MAKDQLNLFGGYYESASKPLSHQNCVNWLPIVAENTALNVNAILTPLSLTQYTTAGSFSNRGADVMANVPYFVNGNTLYSIDTAITLNTIGTIGDSGRVSMANNGTKLCIVVPGKNAYVYDNSTLTLVEITDSDFRPSDTVVFKDGYFVFTASDGTVFFNSELADPTDIDPLDFGTAEINPDKIVAAHVNHNELFIAGEETMEVFQNIGGSGFPFQRIPGANIQKGVHARASMIEFDNTFLFIGGGKNEKTAIWRVVSSQSAEKVSNDGIDSAIQKFTADEIANAFATTFTVEGQFVVAFTFESESIDSITFCYNATSQQWFQLQTGSKPNRWRVNSIVTAYDKLLCGDSEDGRIGYLDEVFTEYGATIYRERTTQPFNINSDAMFWPEIELTVESGVGLTTGQGSDPKIAESHSDDGGRTFTPRKLKSFGKIGEYNKRLIWRRNGRVPSNRVVRFTTAAPTKCNLIRLDGVIQKGYG